MASVPTEPRAAERGPAPFQVDPQVGSSRDLGEGVESHETSSPAIMAATYARSSDDPRGLAGRAEPESAKEPG
jgi:hypothetical protein